MKHLEMLLHEENLRRKRNELPPLTVPSATTLATHRKVLLTPIEYLIATKGERHARNKRGGGSTDIRALFVGELTEVDECKASLITSAKEKGHWERLSRDQRKTLEEIDEEIRKRLTILVQFDVASRMPLAWVISDQPRTEATRALFRMATRDKTREKRIYGCSGDPVAAVGIWHVRNDNGPGLRNSACIAALLGCGAMNTVVRAYQSTDKPYVERMFGTTESILLKLIHGYTGRKAGELPGYDAKANGVLDIDELYGILTCFMIDEYPSMRHTGFGIGGRRPAEVYKELIKTRPHVPPMDPNQRRIHLGWEQEVTPNDEGVRVFSGIWYNSDELLEQVDALGIDGTVSVFVDPDDMRIATVVLPKAKEPIEVLLQCTAFADMTLPEILELMAEWRRENPAVTEVYEDMIMRTRRERHEQLKAIGVERKLPRSFSTIEECKAKAKAVFAGSRIMPSKPLSGCARPGSITDLGADTCVLTIGEGPGVIDGTAVDLSSIDEAPSPIAPEPPDQPAEAATKRSQKPGVAATDGILGRPKDLRGLE